MLFLQLVGGFCFLSYTPIKPDKASYSLACRENVVAFSGTFLPGTQTNQDMIFLDADDAHYILARDRQELVNVLLERIDPDDDDHLLRLAAACLGCEEEDVMWVEMQP